MATMRIDDERAYYDRNARVYRVFAPFYELVTVPIRGVRGEVARLLDAGPAQKVLDVATGTGAQARAFADRGANVIGLDLAEPMLRIARRKNRFANATFVQGDATRLPYRDATFDVTCVSFALHEMPPAVRDRVLREMARVTTPTGTVAIVDYGLPEGRLTAAVVVHAIELYERHEYAQFVKTDLGALLRRAGLDPYFDHPAVGGIVRIVFARPMPRPAVTAW